MSYVRGAATQKAEATDKAEALRKRIENARHRYQEALTEAARLELEATAAENKVKALNTRIRKAEIERTKARTRLADQRADVSGIEKVIQAAEAASAIKIAEAHIAARDIITLAEQRAALITEKAYEQARALEDRAYTNGFKRGRDYAIARKTTLAAVKRVAS